MRWSSPATNGIACSEWRAESGCPEPPAMNTSTTLFYHKTPAKLGFRMPGEWEPHAATWFSWPRPEGISFPDHYDKVPPVFAQLIRHLVQVEEVHINVWNADMESSVRSVLTRQKV